MVLANPSIGQSAGLQQAQLWNFLHEATHDTCGRIRGLIVNDQDFRNFRLLRQGGNARSNYGLLVPGGNNDRDGARARCRSECSSARRIVIDTVHKSIGCGGSVPDCGRLSYYSIR